MRLFIRVMYAIDRPWIGWLEKTWPESRVTKLAVRRRGWYERQLAQ